MAGINDADLRDLFSKFKGEHKSGINLLKQVIAMFDKSSITGAEKRTQAKFAQSAVSRGLAGSTVAPAVSAGLSKEFEDIRVGRLTEAMNNLANFFASPGTIAHVATGGFGEREEPTGSVAPPGFGYGPRGGYVTSGNQQGLGYQPPSNFGQRSNFSGGPAGASFRQGNVSGSVADSGSAWGATAFDISQQSTKKRQTIAGMWAEGRADPVNPYTDAEVDAINDWVASEQAGTYSGVPTGPTTA